MSTEPATNPAAAATVAARFGVPAAVMLAAAGQALLSFRAGGPAASILPGVALYAAAAAVLLIALRFRRPEAPRDVSMTPGLEWGLVALIVVGGAHLRVLHVDLIPPGLNNDEAINAIEATAIASGRPFSTVTEQGISRESMFHHLAALSLRHPGAVLDRLRGLPALFGLQQRLIDDPMMDRVFPVRLVSITAGTLTLLALYGLARRRFGRPVALLAALFMAVSPWHLLYSRAGLRAILAPLFAVVAVALFLRARGSGRLVDHLAWGLALGAGLWTYTSFRAIPLALIAFALYAKSVDRPEDGAPGAAGRWAPAGAGAAGLIAVVLALLARPSMGDFLFRGAYAAFPPRSSWLLNLLHSLTVMNYYPSRYAVIQSDEFISDGVSAVFGSIGLEPESIAVAALGTLGLLYAGWRGLARPRDPAAALVALCWGTTGLLIGPAGPSLTRLLVNVPWLCLCAALLAWRAAEDLAALAPRAGRWGAIAVAAGVALLACVQGYNTFFLQAGRSERAMRYFWPQQTTMGMFVRALSPPDFPADAAVYVLHSYGRETLTYTIGGRGDVHLMTDPSVVDLNAIIASPKSAVFVIEYSEHSRAFAEPLLFLVNRFGAQDLKEYADRRFDPDKPIFYSYTLWKDADRPAPPPGAPFGSAFPPPPG